MGEGTPRAPVRPERMRNSEIRPEYWITGIIPRPLQNWGKVIQLG